MRGALLKKGEMKNNLEFPCCSKRGKDAMVWIKRSYLMVFLIGLLAFGVPTVSSGAALSDNSKPGASVEANPLSLKKVGISHEVSCRDDAKPEAEKKEGEKPNSDKSLSNAVDKMLNNSDSGQRGERFQVSFPGDVMFDSGKWKIKKSAEKLLYNFLNAIKNLKIKEILVEGYTDSKGSEAYNLTLSQRRADAVKAWLIEKGGLDKAKIVTKGFGESNPIAPNTNPDGSDNPKGRAKNRRVEVYVTLLGD